MAQQQGALNVCHNERQLLSLVIPLVVLQVVCGASAASHQVPPVSGEQEPFRLVYAMGASGSNCAPPLVNGSSLEDCVAYCSARPACVAASWGATAAGSCEALSLIDAVSPSLNASGAVAFRRGALAWSGTPVPFAGSLPVVAQETLFFNGAAVSLWNGSVTWTENITANMNAYPVVVGDTALIVCGNVSPLESGCLSVSQLSGTLLWSTVLNSSGPMLFSPTSSGQLVVETTYGSNASLLALNMTTGVVLWNESIPFGWYLTDSGGVLILNAFAPTPTTADYVYGVSAATGQILWTYALPNETFSVADGTPYNVVAKESVVVINFRNSSNVHALEIQTGNLLWRTSLPSPSCTVSTGFISVGDDVVLFVSESTVTALSLGAVSPPGETLWSFEDDQICFGGTVAADASRNQVFFARGGEYPNCTAVFSVNLTTGELLSFNTEPSCPHQILFSFGELIVVQLGYAVSRNASTYVMLWNYSSAAMAQDSVMDYGAINDYAFLALLSGTSTFQLLLR